jgi:hypothetical protein
MGFPSLVTLRRDGRISRRILQVYKNGATRNLLVYSTEMQQISHTLLIYSAGLFRFHSFFTSKLRKFGFARFACLLAVSAKHNFLFRSFEKLVSLQFRNN